MLVEGLGGRGERGQVDRRSSIYLERCLAFLLPLQRLLSGPVTFTLWQLPPCVGWEQCRRSPFQRGSHLCMAMGRKIVHRIERKEENFGG
jgi:hypothetical protein